MSISLEGESELRILLAKGKNIGPATARLFDKRGIETGEGRKNGHLRGEFRGFTIPKAWTQADSGNIIGEIRGRRYDAGFVGTDFLADYGASLEDGESPRLIELARFDVFDKLTRVSAVAKEEEAKEYQNPARFRDKRFLSRYPWLAKRYLRPGFPEDTEIPVDIDTSITGGEEGFVRDGKAAGALVIVETGGTLRRERLSELKVIEEHIQLVFVADLQAIQEKGLVSSLDEFVDKLRNGEKGSRRFFGIFSGAAGSFLTLPFRAKN